VCNFIWILYLHGIYHDLWQPVDGTDIGPEISGIVGPLHVDALNKEASSI
jgi:hypothetical protein